MMKFQAFPKVPRYARDCVITEKIDGTNASVHVLDGRVDDRPETEHVLINYEGVDCYVLAGSRKRFIYPGNDNAAFAKWVWDNVEELVTLGPGSHFGEWWGKGIQRNYGLDEKRFSLFNVNRWTDAHGTRNMCNYDKKIRTVAPECCHIVPVLDLFTMSNESIDLSMKCLKANGSYASPGFDNPEGIMIFHTAAQQLFKKTFENDAGGKG